jgi:hypothetical protein
MNDTVQIPAATRATLDIEFLYLDLTSCTRCQGTEASIDEALAVMQPVLDKLGVTVTRRATRVTSAAQARQLGLKTSPTVRLNGRDIASDVQESACGPCSDISGVPTVCRVWTYQGREFPEAPVGLILEEIMRELSSSLTTAAEPGVATAAVPENLERFFAAGAQPVATACCKDAEQATCCAAEDKAECCGAQPGQQCGCR